jgi:hypothetical protein
VGEREEGRHRKPNCAGAHSVINQIFTDNILWIRQVLEKTLQ